ncbi:hypothetical protein Lfu02_77590 [Longispora fulva]|uniref:DinB family protein n=1 Tax=Longispora fulva TaxID=619741 RepID=A0A8J7GGE2_9ACTN|nr:DinB family protein [Longispora fulva]MBG6136207.1 hypothetical protein [Longispora fulva]GIG63387.1 hypothetical protein Lfu02_77590 [Longispora fulva]
MITPQIDPPLDAPELAAVAGERQILETFVDYFRDVTKNKVAGLTAEQLRIRLVPSRTTLAGLLKHASAVERNWFQHRLAQIPREDIPGNSFGDDDSFLVGPDESLTDLINEYDATCEWSRQIAAGFDLDHTVPHPRLGRVSLRWIYVHMIEELGRHAGHADILREQIDGAQGDQVVAS